MIKKYYRRKTMAKSPPHPLGISIHCHNNKVNKVKSFDEIREARLITAVFLISKPVSANKRSDQKDVQIRLCMLHSSRCCTNFSKRTVQLQSHYVCKLNYF